MNLSFLRLTYYLVSVMVLFCFNLTLNAQIITSVSFNTNNSKIPSNTIKAILIDSSENIWLASRDAGLILFRDNTFTSFNTNNSSIPHNNIYSLALDSLQNLWIGTFGGGIAKYSHSYNKWKVYNSSNSELTYDWIYSIAIDKNNNKWIGTGGSGLFKFDDTTWVNYNSKNSMIPTYKVPYFIFILYQNRINTYFRNIELIIIPIPIMIIKTQ